MSTENALGDRACFKEHEAEQNRVAHANPNGLYRISACSNPLYQHCVDCNAHKDQQTLKAHGKQRAQIVLPCAAQLPVCKRGNGDWSEARQQ